MKKLASFPLRLIAKTGSHYNKSFHAKIFTLFASSESELAAFSRHNKTHYDYCLCFMKNDDGQWFLDTESLSRVRDWVALGAKKGTSHVTKLYHNWKKEWGLYLALSNKLLTTDLSKLSDKKLRREFAKFYNQYLKAGSVAYVADTFMSSGEIDWLEDQLKHELHPGGKIPNLERTVRALTLPVHLSFTIEEEIELLKIAIKIRCYYRGKLPALKDIKLKFPALYERLLNHEKKFYWIQNNYYNVEYLSAGYFYQQVKATIAAHRQNPKALAGALRQKLGHIEEFKILREKTLKTSRLTRYGKNILSIAKLFSKWKDVRKSGVYMGMEQFDRFLKEIAKRRKITVTNLNFLVFDEIMELLKNKTDLQKIIGQRKESTFFALTPKGYFLVAGEKANTYFKYAARGHSTEIAELKGVTASPGNATGKVRVIRKTQDMAEFKRGEILVTNQTTPEFVPIMRKAAAIVTEQGGITSHAAVISRELNKPCVIGTKIAATVFQTGDMVEVNADKGIVKKL